MNTVSDIVGRPRVQMAFVVIVAMLAYANTFTVPFQFDDMPSILMKAWVTDPKLLFSSVITNSRFIGYLSFALNYSIHGFTVAGFHIVNLFIHCGVALLIYRLVLLTYQTPYFADFAVVGHPPLSRLKLIVASFTALLFVSHPVQTEAVTYIVQRLTSLAALFCLLSLVFYIQARLARNASQKKMFLFYSIALAASICAMKTKEISYSFPLVIAIYEILFFQGRSLKRIFYLMPFFLTAAIIPFLSLLVQTSQGDISHAVDQATRLQSTLPRVHYLFTQFNVIATYIRLLVFPVHQNVYHDYPVFTSLFSPQVFIRFLFLLSIFTTGVYLVFRSLKSEAGNIQNTFWLRIVSFGIFWFFITLSVESSVIPIKDVIFEHRVYLPSVGFFLAVAGCFGYVIARWGGYKLINGIVTLVMITSVAATSLATVARNKVWQSEFTLWQDAARKSPNKSFPHYRLGLLYYYQDQNDEAVREFETTVLLDPFASPLPHYYLGTIYYEQGRLEDAERSLLFVTKLKPKSPYAYLYLGNIYAKQGRIQEAESSYKRALTISPGFSEAWKQLVILNEKRNKKGGGKPPRSGR